MSKYKVGLMAGCCAFCFAIVLDAGADQINLQNGERYIGKVVTFSNETVVVQSEVLGTVLVPRSKIASIVLGTNAVVTPIETPVATTQPPRTPPATASAAPDLSTAIQQLRANTNATRQIQQQVQKQILAGADPQATAKFNEMVDGLLNGSLNVDDIRAQAKTAADQLRAAKKEFGDEAGFAIDGYLAILDGFLRETASTASSSATNSLPHSTKPKKTQLLDDE